MTDPLIASAVKKMNKESLVVSLVYYDKDRRALAKPKSVFDFVLITFDNGQSFEINFDTWKLLKDYTFKLKKG